LLTSDQEETISKYANSLAERFKQEQKDPSWIKSRKDRQLLISKLLSKDKIKNLTESDFSRIIKSLWAFNGWTNKDWVVNNIVKSNGMEKIRKYLFDLFYSSESLASRFDNCKIKHMGPSSITEIMAFVDPNEYSLWNDKPRKVFPILGIDQVPKKIFKYSQISGEDYVKCNEIMKEILKLLESQGFENINLLELDLLIWLIFTETAERRKEQKKKKEKVLEKVVETSSVRSKDMSHWDAIGLIVELGNVLGFDTYVADPSKKYKGKTLGGFATSNDVPEQCKSIPGIKKVDAIWFKLDPPFHFFEVEDKGNMRDALLRLYQARYFQSKFFVICPIENRDKFEKYVITDPFKSVRENYLFRSFDELIMMYETVMNYDRVKSRFYGE